MTPRSLFTIILKALGIFFVKDIVLAFPKIALRLYYVNHTL